MMGKSGIEVELVALSDSEGLAQRGLKLSHMRMIAALAEYGQVSAAAQALNISQPAASRLISEMEELLGVGMFERHARGVTLTSYGAALARRARAVLLEMSEANREIEELRSGKGGSVFLGAVTAPAIDLAVPAINRLREEYPRIEIDIEVEASNVLARELLASRRDFVIGRIPDDLNPRLFRSRAIGVERACLVVRGGHPLLSAGSADLAELTAYEWVFQPRGALLRRTIERMFLDRNVALPERMLSTGSLLLTLVMVTQSDAIAPVSVEVANFVSAATGLGGSFGILPTAFAIELQPYSLILLRNRVLSPAAQRLHDFIVEEAERATLAKAARPDPKANREALLLSK